ncbi:MAG: TrkH family potassium uptake protein, partial [Deltaproteobacteria bacterium]|nr:TrkH family potassium uptake protein [Deltaproteobacteria bacterium]
VLGWVILVAFTAVAFHLSGQFVGFAEAFFESMSGYTTTGATVVSAIESLPESLLFQRSFSHWIGGMGIIVLSVAILPELAIGGMQLFSAESSGFDSDKLAPRIAATAQRLWGLYFGITALETLLLVLGGMNGFDAVNHAMSTIATGGFSTKNTSVAAFDSLYIEMVILVFMFISGISFTLQYRALIQLKPQALLRSPEVRLYGLLTLVAIFFVTLSIYVDPPAQADGFGTRIDGFGDAARYSSFQVVSIVTTTGFGTADFSTWTNFSQVLLVGLMIVGGCAGSTAGGSKVVRLYVVMKHAVIQMRRLVRPRLVDALQIGDREVSRETTEGVLGYYLLYFVALFVGSLAMTGLGMDIISGSTASISAMNSIGPGLGTVGAASNFGDIPDAGLYLLSTGMLLGRLEIYTVLVLFTGHFWRRG